jgi:hypothetical protein
MTRITDPTSRITKPRPTSGAAPSHAPPDTLYAPGLSLARSLGWFSLGLGLVELFAPRAVSNLTSVRNTGLLQAYGLREIACGVGILNTTRPTGWLWGRVAGDVLDLATLGLAMAESDDQGRRRACVAAAAVAGVTALDVICAGQLSAAAALEG